MRKIISLHGAWRFALDPAAGGANAAWFTMRLADAVQLPGTTDENGQGQPAEPALDHLTRRCAYIGQAWYQRDIDIPPDWAGCYTRLLLERSKLTQVWIDDRDCGSCDSLTTPHRYELGMLTQGRHTLTICVDNANRPPVGDPHQLSEHTQTNWNGILGRIELQRLEPVYIEDVQVYPDPLTRQATVRAWVRNRSDQPVFVNLGLKARAWNGDENLPCSETERHLGLSPSVPGTQAVRIEARLPLSASSLLWDEFNPHYYRLVATLQTRGIGDQVETVFGLCEFSPRGTQFAVNGQRTFLRGKHDACVFPLTGYAPMDVESWQRVFEIARSYGINHYRFHTWCPPEAAFAAADAVGMYLQPELPNWGAFGAEPHDSYLRREGERILQEYGNHPSFVMFALGNELGQNRPAMAEMVRHFRALDNRRLYAQGSNNFFNDPSYAPGDDYWTTMRTARAGGMTRGSFSHADLPLGHIQADPPSGLHDYREAIQGVSAPVIGHEVGQYQVYPDYSEIERYTGVLQPANLEAFRERLDRAGMRDQAGDFARTSGALAALCYREEIETALRTPGFGGFQLLDLQDFPGQGTALVGILNAFMQSKGLIAPEKWREFCAPTVLLARLPRYAWKVNETFEAGIQLAHYGQHRLTDAAAAWSISPPEGPAIAAGVLPSTTIAPGTLADLGRIAVPLHNVKAPAQLTLRLELHSVSGDGIVNHYQLWVYPPSNAGNAPAGVTLRRAFDAQTRELLAGGASVVLIPALGQVSNSVAGFFTPDFWCYPMFRGIAASQGLPPAPGTLGLLCDPAHASLAQFPTRFHAEWQWWQLLMRSRPIILDLAPAGYRPIAQVIDNFERNHKLGLIFEARVGSGRLLVCASDLDGLRGIPEADQLLSSLLAYAASDAFQPAVELDEQLLQKVLE